MPRLTLQSKAFIALTFLLAVMLLIFVGFSRLGLQRGLGPYVAEIELARMDWLASRLQNVYTQEAGWDKLRKQPELWRELRYPDEVPMHREGAPFTPGRRQPSGAPPSGGGVRNPAPWGETQHSSGLHLHPPSEFQSQSPEGWPQPNDDPMHHGIAEEQPPEGPADALPLRLGLLDANSQLIAGVPARSGFARTALHDDKGHTIGYLVLSPPSGLKRDADRAFVAQQMGFVVWTGVAGLALALVLSWWLARRWLAPIGALMEGARGVAAGRLSTRVPLQGNDELSNLARTFNDMAEQLGAMEATRRQWIGDMAHELRTPLAAMRAEIEALQDGVRAFDPRTALRLHRQVMRLIQLVGDLRSSLDAGDGGMPAVMIPIQPLLLLNEAIASMQQRFAQVGVELHADNLKALPADAPAPLVRGDVQLLHRVFLNLLENSRRYTDAGGHLQISAAIDRQNPQPTLVLRFDDTAPGVATHELPRIFERLYRAETSRTRERGDLGGSGLGLTICRAIVQAHGGQIHADASPLGGLRITLTLPLLENPS